MHVSAAIHHAAFLQPEIHARWLFDFFLAHCGAAPPTSAVRLRVFTRWDSPVLPAVGELLFSPSRPASAGPVPVVLFELYNKSGDGTVGYHYDPFLPGRGQQPPSPSGRAKAAAFASES